MSQLVVANASQAYCAICNGPCKFLNNVSSSTLTWPPKQEETKLKIRRSSRVKKIPLKKKKSNRFPQREAVMKRMPSIRQGPLTDFVDKKDYSTMKVAQNSIKSTKCVDQLISQKSMAPSLIPASSGSTDNSKILWNLVPQRTAALKNVASVQNGPLPVFKPMKSSMNMCTPSGPTQKTVLKSGPDVVAQRMAALKRVASVQNGPQTDYKPKTRPAIQQKASVAFARKVVGKSSIKKSLKYIAHLNNFRSQFGSDDRSTMKTRLSNPGLIIIDDKNGKRLFVYDSLNMFSDIMELFSRRVGTLGAALGPLVYPATIRANATISYVPSGSFEKIVKANPPLCSTLYELGSYFRNNRV